MLLISVKMVYHFREQIKKTCFNLHLIMVTCILLPKRHVFMSLLFILKCFKKSFIIRSLKRDNELDLFRRLEKLSIKQINRDGAIEFLRLCQRFYLTSTFARVDEMKARKWKQSS